ncbi:uncharacterized protein LOC110823435 [Carica papaya]|uniref:uncharacterized protein LOC110823435 n=1 Tax=Carica papaya TaxID=3649 RepID=UPI000B8CB3A2|nr:uncharacterized protein LOC110823435 [Carica papaya]
MRKIKGFEFLKMILSIRIVGPVSPKLVQGVVMFITITSKFPGDSSPEIGSCYLQEAMRRRFCTKEYVYPKENCPACEPCNGSSGSDDKPKFRSRWNTMMVCKSSELGILHFYRTVEVMMSCELMSYR